MSPSNLSGFTIVELLVVITIIVVLLALLAPALDKAVYQAELAVCGAQLKAIATGGNTYAMANRRHYPDTGRGLGNNPQQAWIGTGDGSAAHDRRKVLRAALGDLNKVFNDPLTNADLDFERSTATYTYSNYNLWFAWSYAGRQGMKRLGDRFTWIERSDIDHTIATERSSNMLASDRDEIARDREAQSSHPDADGVLFLMRRQDQISPWGNNETLGPAGNTITQAIWWSNNSPSRGETDSNFAAADGAVVRFNAIHWNEDERLARAPIYPDPASYYPKYFHYLPK